MSLKSFALAASLLAAATATSVTRAGDTLAWSQNGTLYIIGDDTANAVIVKLYIDRVLVEDDSNGTINGSEPIEVIAGAIDRVVVDMGGGADQIQVFAVGRDLVDGVDVDTGTGSDDERVIVAGFPDCEVGDVAVVTGSGNDRISIGVVWDPSTNPTPGPIFIGDVEVYSGAGNDLTAVQADVAGTIFIDAGEGDNTGTFALLTTQSEVTWIGGSGNDIVALDSVIATAPFEIDTGDGSNEVIFYGGMFLDDLVIDMGSGVDRVSQDASALFARFGAENPGIDFTSKPILVSGEFEIDGGNGFTSIELTNLDVADLEIDTYNGDDVIILTASTIDDLDIDTRGEWDEVRLIEVNCQDLTVRLGDGNDDLVLTGCTIGSNSLNGQGGTVDTIQTDGQCTYTTLNHQNFEHVYISENQSNTTTRTSTTYPTRQTSTETTKDGTTRK